MRTERRTSRPRDFPLSNSGSASNLPTSSLNFLYHPDPVQRHSGAITNAANVLIEYAEDPDDGRDDGRIPTRRNSHDLVSPVRSSRHYRHPEAVSSRGAGHPVGLFRPTPSGHGACDPGAAR